MEFTIADPKEWCLDVLRMLYVRKEISSKASAPHIRAAWQRNFGKKGQKFTVTFLIKAGLFSEERTLQRVVEVDAVSLLQILQINEENSDATFVAQQKVTALMETEDEYANACCLLVAFCTKDYAEDCLKAIVAQKSLKGQLCMINAMEKVAKRAETKYFNIHIQA